MIFLRAAQREFTQNAVAVFVALFAILISTVLIRLLGQAAGGRVPADAVLALIGFGAIAQMPVVLSLTSSSRSSCPCPAAIGIRKWWCGSPAACR
jgi:lipopolysaccharide export system permease protein